MPVLSKHVPRSALPAGPRARFILQLKFFYYVIDSYLRTSDKGLAHFLLKTFPTAHTSTP